MTVPLATLALRSAVQQRAPGGSVLLQAGARSTALCTQALTVCMLSMRRR